MALNLLSPTEANLIFGENQSQGQPGMAVIYTIIKKKDPAPDVTKLCLGKELRGCRDEPLSWWGSNEIVSKSCQLMGPGRLDWTGQEWPLCLPQEPVHDPASSAGAEAALLL